MEFRMMMDILIIGCGVYVIYWAMQMILTKKVPEMLVGKGFPLSRAKDPQGFVKATFPFTFALGIILFIAGILGALQVFAAYPVADTMISVVLVIVIFLYGSFLLKAQQKYLIGNETKNKKNNKKK